MIETYIIVSEQYDSSIEPALLMSDARRPITSGNNLRFQKFRCRLYDMRNFYFTNRVVDLWNSLPNRVVQLLIILQHLKLDLISTGIKK